MTSVSSLISFLKSHDCTIAAYSVSNGIKVACEVADKSGRVTIQTCIISASLKAARDWLGY